mmetsp:Transcript_28111/g.43303  ORF Transcript_28111/g.43303 Transcript_28111/m.43303 type:complete len:204 (+) Transcript_28111:615-1226(+)
MDHKISRKDFQRPTSGTSDPNALQGVPRHNFSVHLDSVRSRSCQAIRKLFVSRFHILPFLLQILVHSIKISRGPRTGRDTDIAVFFRNPRILRFQNLHLDTLSLCHICLSNIFQRNPLLQLLFDADNVLLASGFGKFSPLFLSAGFLEFGILCFQQSSNGNFPFLLFSVVFVVHIEGAVVIFFRLRRPEYDVPVPLNIVATVK